MKRLLGLLCGLLFCNLLGSAQIAPVYSKVELSPPINTRLSQIINHPNQLKVHLNLLDATVVSTQVFLKFHIQGGHIHIQNREEIVQTYEVFSGLPLCLDNLNLSLYFNSNNLLFSGITRSEYISSGQELPFGMYKIWVEVFEVKTRNRISLNEVPALFNVVRNDPPLIVSPTLGQEVKSNDQLMLSFCWIPRHLGGISLGYSTYYEFEMLEVPQNYLGDIQALFGVLTPFYFERTSKDHIYYDYSYPILNRNCRYAFRIKVICEHPFLGDLYFQNKGYSEVSYFYFKEDCPKVRDLRAQVKSPYLVNITWTHDFYSQNDFLYKKKEVEDAQWFSLNNIVSPLEISELDPATTYQCKIVTQCSDKEVVETNIMEFTTLDLESPSFWCGNHKFETNKDQTPLIMLRRYDTVVTYSGFKMVIGEVSGENGTFSGKATLTVPFWANTGINFKFKNIFVNKQFHLVKGQFIGVGGD